MDTLCAARCVISQYGGGKKVPHAAIFHRKGEHAIVETVPCEKVNRSLAITVLDANILLLRL